MRCALLFLSLAGLSAAVVPLAQRTPPEVFDGIPANPIGMKYRLRNPGKNPNQLSLIINDRIKSDQILLTPKDATIDKIDDVEGKLEFMAYMQELNDWGPQGPPTGFSSREFRILRKKRSVYRGIKRRSIKNPTAENVGYAILALAQMTLKAEAQALKNSTEYKEAAEFVEELLKSEKEAVKTKRETVQMPSSVKEWLDLGLSLVKRMKQEGVVNAVENTAKELADAYEEQKHKVEKELIERSKHSDFAEFVFDRDAEAKFDKLAAEKLRTVQAIPEEQRSKRTVPSVTLHGTYRLVPKNWNKEEMEVVYTGLMRAEREKRQIEAFRKFAEKLVF